ncbi:uncharacterized protein LOC132545842 [Ylistrum balloti]|uniref:uncharacterized protein LOC132545842 n=1 Tax=Ylistrum balloti TaxID=509963 RepID=UPI002905EEA4|nr:uncharacterized protein LOC132545842 [Ylistrum balloti]
MEMQSGNTDISKARLLCSSLSKGNGGHSRQEVNVQPPSDNCNCCAKCEYRCRIQIIISCCACVVIVTMCWVTIGYNNHTCAMTKDSFDSRFFNLEQKLYRLQKKYTVTKLSHLMRERDRNIHRQNLGSHESTDDALKESRVNVPSKMNIVKRSVDICKHAKKKQKCRKRLERKSKKKRTGQALVRLVNTTVHKALGKTVKQAVAKAMEKRSLLSVHFEGDGNEHRPRGNEAFAGRFHKWQYSEWAYQKEFLKEKFRLDFNSGSVVIADSGIYMVYAQVTLMGEPDQGFLVIQVHHKGNEEKVLTKCMMDFQHEQEVRHDLHVRQMKKYITCSSVGVFKLDSGDSVFLKHTEDTNVKADFRGNASFFGFVKLAEA